MIFGANPLPPEEAEVSEKLKALIAANPWLTHNRLLSRLQSVRKENASGKVKRAKFIQIAKEIDNAIAPFAPCRQGCSHCCNGFTMLFKHEAEVLARVTGRKMTHVPPPTYRDLQRQGKSQFAPCPFLVERECSVYEHRPLACRLTHSLNENPDDCISTDGRLAKVNIYEVDSFMRTYDELAERMDYTDLVGTILEYFPSK